MAVETFRRYQKYRECIHHRGAFRVLEKLAV